MTGSSGAGEPPVTRVEIPAGQGVQVGDHNTQRNEFNIENYIQNLIQPPPAPVPGHVVAGDVPQPPPARGASDKMHQFAGAIPGR
jgi:hypothetical protein